MVGVFCLASNARAEAVRPFEVQLRFGLETPTSHSPVRLRKPIVPPTSIETATESPYTNGPSLVLSGALRFSPRFALALEGKYRATSSTAPDGYEDLSRHALGLQVSGKWFPWPSAFLEPWASVGVGYLRDMQTFRGAAGGGSEAHATIVHNGMTVPTTVGVEHAFTEWLRAGVFATLEPTVALSGYREDAIQGTPDFKSDGDALTYVSWSVGMSVTVPLGRP
jgi:hypothetical protein